MSEPILRVLVVDDEPLARRGLCQLLERHRDVVITEARNGRDAVALLAQTRPDLVFLDVQMPELDGFDVVRAVGPDRMPPVIFVTAFEQHAVRAFETEAVDYLVKPVTDQRFDEAMRRARRHLAVDALAAASRSLSAVSGATGSSSESPVAAELTAAAAAAPPAISTRLVAPAAFGGDTAFELADIDWIGAEDYYAAVYLGGRQCLLRESLASFEARLDPSKFARVHRSAIVNLSRVRELTTSADEMSVVLHDGTRLPVSRRRRSQLMAVLRQHATPSSSSETPSSR